MQLFLISSTFRVDGDSNNVGYGDSVSFCLSPKIR